MLRDELPHVDRSIDDAPGFDNEPKSDLIDARHELREPIVGARSTGVRGESPNVHELML